MGSLTDFCTVWDSLQPLDIGGDVDIESFILDLLRNMGPPYSDQVLMGYG